MAGWNSTARGFDAGSAFTAEGTVPNSAHVLWTKPLSFGGLVGGVDGPAFYHDGRSYEYWFKPPVIINGRVYYNTIGADEPIPSNTWTRPLGMPSITCVDMTNGQTLFTIPNATLQLGQIYNYVSPNQAGAFAYLWTTDWRMFDAWTGQQILTLINVPSGTITRGSDGSIIIYNLAYNATKTVSAPTPVSVGLSAERTYPNQWVLTKWNSSRAIPPAGDVNPGYAALFGTSSAWQWRPYLYSGFVINAVGNTSLPNADLFNAVVNRNTNGIERQTPVLNITGQALSSFLQSGMYLKSNGQDVILSYANGIQFQGYSMKDGTTLFNSTLNVPTTMPAIDGLVGIGSFQNTYESNGIFYEFLKATMQWIAYDVQTGQVKWVAEPLTNAWGMYVPSAIAAYGKFFAGGYDGELTAYDINNGNKLWTYFPGSAGFQSPYGVWPIYSGLTAGDGKIIFTTSEHGNGVEPLYSGERIYVVDANTGKNVWNMSGWFEQPAIADGKLLSHNCYDNQLYAFGKGPSATTVEAPLAAINKGSSLIIQGTVTDQSVGAKGTPAISDADMSQWMAYLYSQQAAPANAQGVPVRLQAIDPNGNWQELGAVTSDSAGNYAVMWTPPVEGLYTIIATFEGSNSYYSSYAETHIAVQLAPSAAPTTTPPPTETPTATPTVAPTASPSPAPQPEAGPSTDMYIIAAAAVVIIVVVAVAALVLRKRK
jgi:hypothetical protein